MTYKVWVICEGAVEEDEEFEATSARDQRAVDLAASCRAECGPETSWEVWVANVTEGCSVGEWAGEEAVLVFESEVSHEEV